jgi:hypothetical protein
LDFALALPSSTLSLGRTRKNSSTANAARQDTPPPMSQSKTARFFASRLNCVGAAILKVPLLCVFRVLDLGATIQAPVCPSISWSARATTWADSGRSSGFLARSCITRSDSAAGASALSKIGGAGLSKARAESMEMVSVPLKGIAPVHIR